jgi:hypothetical protein
MNISKEELDDKMKVLLSNNDFSKHIENSDKRVVKLSDLEYYQDVYELLPKWENFRIILYRTNNKFGALGMYDKKK